MIRIMSSVLGDAGKTLRGINRWKPDYWLTLRFKVTLSPNPDPCKHNTYIETDTHSDQEGGILLYNLRVFGVSVFFCIC